MNCRWRTLATVLWTALVVAGCRADGPPGRSSQEPDPPPPNMVAVTLRLTEHHIEPSVITVPVGAVVVVTVQNDGERDHDLAVNVYGVESNILRPGKTEVIRFTADRAGTFDVICTLKGHKEKGMIGKLIVQ